jgi:hypothetical protein
MTLSLVASLGGTAVDEALRGLIGVFELAFSGRIRAYYVEGSYADRSAVATSDIDLTVIFKDRFVDEDESDAARRLRSYCADLSAFELDLDIIDEAQAEHGVFPSLKLAGVCVYGEDIRERLALPPIEEWTRDRMHAAYWLMIKLFNRPIPVRTPLGYPLAEDEFFGYAERLMRVPDGSEVRCTRDLIRLTGWAATALVALRAGRYVARKADCYEMYRQLIGDEWSDLLRQIYQRCKIDWSYRIPEAPADRQALRAICRRSLAFENHFLGIFREFVLAELHSDNDGVRRAACRLLGEISYDDHVIARALLAQGVLDLPRGD